MDWTIRQLRPRHGLGLLLVATASATQLAHADAAPPLEVTAKLVEIPSKMPPDDLYDYAYYVMRPRLARVPGAGQVAVSASDTREIEVVTDPARLLSAGLTVHDVAEKLKSAAVAAASRGRGRGAHRALRLGFAAARQCHAARGWKMARALGRSRAHRRAHVPR